MLILMVVSYLVPKDTYKTYIQFFVGIFMIVLLLKPVLEILILDDPSRIYEVFDTVNQQLDSMDIQMEEQEGLFEHFFFKGEGN